MFENLTVAEQGERTRGWKSPVTHCTAGVILSRQLPEYEREPTVRNTEILIATRTSGTAEAMGFKQTHFGTYINPTDEIAADSIVRMLESKLGLKVNADRLEFRGLVGPWLWKSRLIMTGNELTLTITDEPAEKLSPFQMSVFGGDITGLDIGSHDQTISDPHWLRFEDLISRYGKDVTCIYWSVFCLWATQSPSIAGRWRPGTYRFETR
jgi:hypothetical protein